MELPVSVLQGLGPQAAQALDTAFDIQTVADLAQCRHAAIAQAIVTLARYEERHTPQERKLARAMHGTARQLIHNMVFGVSQGFSKNLEIVGVGYNAKMEGKNLVLAIGFCHPVKMPVPTGLQVATPKPTIIEINGVDKQLVGQFAAEIRRVRPPEPYKGKGIRYQGEEVRRKAAKGVGA